MVKKDDWKTVEMSDLNEHFILERDLSKQDIDFIKEGHRPEEMEDKWFMYYADEKLFIHRSWTGYCIFIIDINDSGRLNVIVNRNPNQYKNEKIEDDKILLNILLNTLIREIEKNAKLMKQYIERKTDFKPED